MDILIKNMEMPSCCGLCPCFHAEHPMYCQADKKIKMTAPYGKRMEDCPLVALPSHGDLIDEDEFRQVIYREIRNHKEDEPITMILKGILWEMDNAPVIVEASNE